MLPNNGNVIMTAEHAAAIAGNARVVPTRSIQAGLSALLAYDQRATAGENDEAMREAIGSVTTGAVTTASRDVDLDGLAVRGGSISACWTRSRSLAERPSTRSPRPSSRRCSQSRTTR